MADDILGVGGELVPEPPKDDQPKDEQRWGPSPLRTLLRYHLEDKQLNLVRTVLLYEPRTDKIWIDDRTLYIRYDGPYDDASARALRDAVSLSFSIHHIASTYKVPDTAVVLWEAS